MKKVAIVTGANQGLGFALVKKLCCSLGSDYDVFLTARNTEKGERAVRALNEMNIYPEFFRLDVTSDENCVEFKEILTSHYGGVDIFIHNAASRISPEIPNSEQVEQFIGVNNLGTTRMIKEFGPLLKDNSKFIVVASSFGSLKHLAPIHHDKFDFTRQRLEDIDDVMRTYIETVKSGKDKVEGWPEWINTVSKIGQVAEMKIFAKQMREAGAKERNISVFAVCPGLMDTDASRPWFKDMSAAKSTDEAAEILMPLVLESEWNEQYYGQLVRYGKIVPWKE